MPCFDAAGSVRERAHAPYSRFRVGAAVIDETGALHTGCNVENAAYPEGICAEAAAIAAMVAGGGRRIRAIAVIGSGPAMTTPCGGCRQRIREFADADTPDPSARSGDGCAPQPLTGRIAATRLRPCQSEGRDPMSEDYDAAIAEARAALMRADFPRDHALRHRARDRARRAGR